MLDLQNEEEARRSRERAEHAELWAVCERRLEDYVPYGANRDREGPEEASAHDVGDQTSSATEEASYRGDCSCGCRYFYTLSGALGADWGVCANPASHRAGLLTWEHQGCRAFTPFSPRARIDQARDRLPRARSARALLFDAFWRAYIEVEQGLVDLGSERDVPFRELRAGHLAAFAREITSDQQTFADLIMLDELYARLRPRRPDAGATGPQETPSAEDVAAALSTADRVLAWISASLTSDAP